MDNVITAYHAFAKKKLSFGDLYFILDKPGQKPTFDIL